MGEVLVKSVKTDDGIRFFQVIVLGGIPVDRDCVMQCGLCKILRKTSTHGRSLEFIY